MEYRQLGKSGLKMSVIGMGGNTFGRYTDEKGTSDIINKALDLGINHLDTANIYNRGVSEEHLGKAVKGRRSEAVIVTKLGGAMGQGPNQSGNSRQNIMDSAHASLKRLDTDFIDLYLLHFPDRNTPIEESLRALDDLVRQGKVRYIGCSNFSAWENCEAMWTSQSVSLNSFVANQVAYNLLNRRIENELVPFCQEYGVGIIPYSPLAGGFLTGKYRPDAPAPEGTRGHNNAMFARNLTEKNFALLSSLDEFCASRGHTVGELAIAWLVARPGVSSVIIGATKPEQVEENAAATEWKLTPEDIEELDVITKGRE